MSYNQGNPNLGATFVPGGMDDYYMPTATPDLVSPAPQRIMPEVPEQMQDSLSRLELEANEPANAQRLAAQPPNLYGNSNGGSTSSQPSPNRTQPQNHDYHKIASRDVDLPSFSPFPKLQNRPPNVPQSDDEKEAMLEDARLPVLSSNDPEMQLAWAQDALAYVDASILHEERISQSQPGRPSTPQVEHQLKTDAVNIVSFLANQGHPKAEYMKGMWLEFGKFGMRTDKKEAFRSYSRSADKGYSRAEYRIGMQYEGSNDPVKALIHYNRGSEKGDSASNYRLGMMTLLGQHGQPQDYARGVQLLRQAAEGADENAPQGAYVLGMLYARELPQITIPEIFLPYDERSARVNIEKAAFLGFAKALAKMGSAYELCSLGLEFNPALSLHYNALAARQGESEADMAISKWFLCGYEGVFQKNEELAYTYAQRAALTGLATAEFAMGYFNEIGMYVPVNIEKAMEWYQKAAKSGNVDAQGRIEGISKSRTLSKKDHEDVAISKIRSQYGSQRGGRPERFKQSTAPQLPTISDEPDISSQRPISTPGAIIPPSRGSTTTPYPIDDKPPVIGQFDRPTSTTPYPLGEGPVGHPRGPQQAGPGANFLSPDFRSATAIPTERPSSAFGIRPQMYSQPGPGQALTPNGRGGPLQRPHSLADLNQVRPLQPHGQQQSNLRVASGPTPRPQTTHPPRIDSASVQPAVNLGFEAPDDKYGSKDKSGVGANNRPGSNILPKPQQQNLPPQQNMHAASRLPSQQRPPVGGPAPSGQYQQRPPQNARPPQQYQQPSQQYQQPSRPYQQPSQQYQQPPPGPAKPSKPSHQAPSSSKPAGRPGAGGPQPIKPAAANRPPGKGPKTFDEMGVPATKQDSECIMM